MKYKVKSVDRNLLISHKFLEKDENNSNSLLNVSSFKSVLKDMNENDTNEFNNNKEINEVINKAIIEENGNKNTDEELIKELKTENIDYDNVLMDLSLTFKNHQKIVDRINLLDNIEWKAGLHSMFRNKTISELNNFAGRRKKIGLKFINSIKEDVSDLPKQFSKWIDEG